MYYGNFRGLISVLFLVVAQCLSAQQDTTMSGIELQVKEDTINVFAMPGNTMKEVESVSYKLFSDQKWEELIDFCERSIKQGFDYYYIRVRLGTGYFKLKKYRKAIVHFEEALKFNGGDDYAMDFLHASYIFAERYNAAKWLSKSFSPSLAQSLRSKEFSSIDLISVEGGFKGADSSRLFKNPYFTSAGLGHSIERRVFLFHNLSYYRQNEYRFSVEQLQYYLKATLPLKNGFLLSGGAHVVHINSDIRSVEQSVSTYSYEVPGGPGIPGQPPPPPRTVSVTTVINTDKFTTHKTDNFIGAASLVKHFSTFDLSLGATSCSFDTTFQNQVDVGLTVYPLRNNRAYFGTLVYFHKEDQTQVQAALAPFASIYLTPKVNVTLNYFYNEGPNVSEAGGSLVSNSTDYTLHRAAISSFVRVNPVVWLYGTCGYEIKKHFTLGYHYNYYIFALGLRVTPQYK